MLAGRSLPTPASKKRSNNTTTITHQNHERASTSFNVMTLGNKEFEGNVSDSQNMSQQSKNSMSNKFNTNKREESCT